MVGVSAANSQRGAVPMGWITRESSRRIRWNGGNQSRGTVPLHAHRSHVACIPVYAEGPAKRRKK